MSSEDKVQVVPTTTVRYRCRRTATSRQICTIPRGAQAYLSTLNKVGVLLSVSNAENFPLGLELVRSSQTRLWSLIQTAFLRGDRSLLGQCRCLEQLRLCTYIPLDQLVLPVSPFVFQVKSARQGMIGTIKDAFEKAVVATKRCESVSAMASSSSPMLMDMARVYWGGAISLARVNDVACSAVFGFDEQLCHLLSRMDDFALEYFLRSNQHQFSIVGDDKAAKNDERSEIQALFCDLIQCVCDERDVDDLKLKLIIAINTLRLSARDIKNELTTETRAQKVLPEVMEFIGQTLAQLGVRYQMLHRALALMTETGEQTDEIRLIGRRMVERWKISRQHYTTLKLCKDEKEAISVLYQLAVSDRKSGRARLQAQVWVAMVMAHEFWQQEIDELKGAMQACLQVCSQSDQ